jgi:hypothetical protein
MKLAGWIILILASLTSAGALGLAVGLWWFDPRSAWTHVGLSCGMLVEAAVMGFLARYIMWEQLKDYR